VRVLNSDKFDHLAEDLKHSRKYSSHNLVQIKEEERITEAIEEENINENENENGNEIGDSNLDQ
jgi:hypothetical protein